MSSNTSPDRIDGYIRRLFAREGRFSDHPADTGGATKFGITTSTLSAFLGRRATLEDVVALTADTAAVIYRTQYFDNHRLGALPDEIEEQVFDFGVNSGPYVAIKALQECLGVTPDGIIGPVTIAAAVTACLPDNGRRLNNLLAIWRALMLARICRRDPSQLAFLAGWLSRTLDFIN